MASADFGLWIISKITSNTVKHKSIRFQKHPKKNIQIRKIRHFKSKTNLYKKCNNPWWNSQRSKVFGHFRCRQAATLVGPYHRKRALNPPKLAGIFRLPTIFRWNLVIFWWTPQFDLAICNLEQALWSPMIQSQPYEFIAMNYHGKGHWAILSLWWVHIQSFCPEEKAGNLFTKRPEVTSFEQITTSLANQKCDQFLQFWLPKWFVQPPK